MIGALGYSGFLDGGGGGGTGGGDTLQDVIINGNVLTQNNTIDGAGFDLTFNNIENFLVSTGNVEFINSTTLNDFLAISTLGSFSLFGDINNDGNYGRTLAVSPNGYTQIKSSNLADNVYLDRFQIGGSNDIAPITFDNSNLFIITPPNDLSTDYSTLCRDNTTGEVGLISGGAFPFTGWDDMLSVGQMQTTDRTADAGANIFNLKGTNLNFGDIDNLNFGTFFSIKDEDKSFLFNNILSDSKLGINIANPQYALDVLGEFNVAGVGNLTNFYTDYNNTYIYATGNTVLDISSTNTNISANGNPILEGSDGLTILKISGGGNVIEASTSGTNISANGNPYIYIIEDIGVGGRLGINTAAPTEALEVAGNIKTSSGLILPTYPTINLTTGDYTATTAGIYQITQGSLTNSFILPDATVLDGQTITVVNASGVISPVSNSLLVTLLQDDSVTIFSAIGGIWYGLAKL